MSAATDGKRPASSFRIDPVEPGATVPTLRVAGQLHLSHAAELWRDLGRALDGAPAAVRVDLSQLTSTDVATLALLLAQLSRHGGPRAFERIVGAHGNVAEVLGLL